MLLTDLPRNVRYCESTYKTQDVFSKFVGSQSICHKEFNSVNHHNTCVPKRNLKFEMFSKMDRLQIKLVLVPFGLYLSWMNSTQRALKSLYVAFSLSFPNTFSLQHLLVQEYIQCLGGGKCSPGCLYSCDTHQAVVNLSNCQWNLCTSAWKVHLHEQCSQQ